MGRFYVVLFFLFTGLRWEIRGYLRDLWYEGGGFIFFLEVVVGKFLGRRGFLSRVLKDEEKFVITWEVYSSCLSNGG